ncbi:MAG: glycoside-pentoside-hexuronide (GPH):cation symporter [Clostridiales bacterium]|nr:glycoside-pentoside-hexuronide (GPH):cation symporter [Clostridiales bacterium]
MDNRKSLTTQKFGLLIGTGGSTAIYAFTTAFAMLFFTSVMGLSPAVVGTIMLVSKVWDAINDPLCGVLIDRTPTRKFGQIKPWIFFGAIGIAVFGVLMFVVPGFGNTGKVVWSLIMYNGIGMAFTAFVIGLVTIMPRITNIQIERVSLSAYFFIGQTLSAIIVTAIAMPLITHFSASSPVNAYWNTALIICAVGLALTMILIFVVKERVSAENKDESSKPLLKDSLVSILHNKPFLLVALICLINGIALGMHNSSLAQYIVFGLKNPEISSLIMPIIYVGAFLAGLLAKPLARLDKVRMTKISFIIVLVGILLRLITKDAFLPLMIGGEFAIGLGSGLFNVYMVAMLFDTAEYGYRKTGVQNNALIMSSMTFQLKIGQGVGAALMGFWLELGGYISTATEQPESAVKALFDVNLIPFLAVAIISFILMYFYKLSDSRMTKIMDERSSAETENTEVENAKAENND